MARWLRALAALAEVPVSFLNKGRAGEMAQLFRALVTLAEHLG